MRGFIFIMVFISVFFLAQAQKNIVWTSYYDKEKNLVGFKDKSGAIRLQPQFSESLLAKKLEFIMAINQFQNQIWQSYYLTTTGRVVGRDSVYFFNNIEDCENEGFIRFRDEKTDKAGLFNRMGDVVVPAYYNELTKVKNGKIIALKGAEKKYFNNNEHYEWIGGKELLIDTNNTVLIENMKSDFWLNFYSLKVAKNPSKDSLRQSFRAVDGSYYTFICFEKEFNNWFRTKLLNHLTKESLSAVVFDEVTSWKDQQGWIKETKQTFIDKKAECVMAELLQLKDQSITYNLFLDRLNEFMFTSGYFNRFYNNCGESMSWKYPVASIVIERDEGQESFEFLRTNDGYKLICVSIKKCK